MNLVLALVYFSVFADIDSCVTLYSSFLSVSLLPQMSLGGFEITPPVTFRLQSGSGPVHISGQHFVRKLSGYQLVFTLL